MTDRKKKSLIIRMLNSICASVLIGSFIYAAIAGFEAVAVGAMIVALVSASTPVILSGEGVLEVLLGIVEALVEGIMTIVEGILSAISGLFG